MYVVPVACPSAMVRGVVQKDDSALRPVHSPDVADGPALVAADASAVPVAAHLTVPGRDLSAKFPVPDHDCQSAMVRDCHPSASVDAPPVLPAVHSSERPALLALAE